MYHYVYVCILVYNKFYPVLFSAFLNRSFSSYSTTTMVASSTPRDRVDSPVLPPLYNTGPRSILL